MKNLSLVFLGAAALIACTTACNSSKPVVAGPVATETPAQTYAAVHKILYGEWMVYKVGNQLVKGSERPYVIFDGENTTDIPNVIKLYANNGCNSINGTYKVSAGGQMQPATDFISTLRMCPDAPYEMGMTLALNNVRKYTLDKLGNDYILDMKGANDSTLMVLRKYDLNFINGAWAVTSINGQKVAENSGINLVIDTPEQKIHGNVGCNTMNGEIVINPDMQNSIGFKNMITTRMTCPEIATEQALLQALINVSTVSPFDDMAGANLKDEAGNTIIVLKRIQLR